jgi:23S rRNA U2552 (ribose-2'-O)-methylase RlmE/FtsJ
MQCHLTTQPANFLPIKDVIRKYSLSSSAWYQRHIQDPYVKRSKTEGYRSRAAFKLEEIALKYNLFSPTNPSLPVDSNSIKSSVFHVLDCGAAPGSPYTITTKVGIGRH